MVYKQREVDAGESIKDLCAVSIASWLQTIGLEEFAGVFLTNYICVRGSWSTRSGNLRSLGLTDLDEMFIFSGKGNIYNC